MGRDYTIPGIMGDAANSDDSGYDLSMDHPGYTLPFSNIAYHLYPENNDLSTRNNAAVAERAFQRIEDSYEEYERMTDVFQVELDRRQQLADVRKERERAAKEERQRQLKETKRKSKKRAASVSIASSSASSSSAPTPSLLATSVPSFSSSWLSKTPQHQHRSIRKKRKQGIPVHPSVVDRIPGITLRIQPDLEQQLQVEIVKNVDDYQDEESLMVTVPEDMELDSPMDMDLMVPRATREGSTSSVSGRSSSIGSREEPLSPPRRSRTELDLDMIRKSIESGRPSYVPLLSSPWQSSMPTESFLYQQLKQEDMDDGQDLRMASNSGASHLYQKHQHQNGFGNGSRSLDLKVPTESGLRLSSEDSDDHLEQENSRTPTAVVKRAESPLSWNNFSTRECKVNKVIGRYDPEFELLEGIVQEAVARQYAAAHHPSANEEPSDREGSQTKDQKNRQSSSHRQENDGSFVIPAAQRTIGTRNSSRRQGGLASVTETSTTTTSLSPKKTRATRSRTHYGDGEIDRGTGVELVEAYDDIERVLKEKRQRKREERRRAESEAASMNENMSEAGRDEDNGYQDDHEVGLGDDIMNEEEDAKGHAEICQSSLEPQKQQPASRFKKPPPLSSAALQNDITQENRSRATPTSPPSPPHSRQVTPSKGESTVTSRRASLSLPHGRGGAHVMSHAESDTTSTPPTTPTRTTISDNANPGQDQQFHTAALPVAGKTRSRARSLSIMSESDKSTSMGFFEHALDLMEAKRKAALAKKKAAAATAAAAPSHAIATAASASASISTSINDTLDPNELERELKNLSSKSTETCVASNLPKSSKSLPGRVLRRVRSQHHDPFYVTEPTTSSARADKDSRNLDSKDGDVLIDLLDPDCTSCRLELSVDERRSWKQARMAGEVQLNPRTWSRTAILCDACRTQYQRHRLRCTQCFYIPVMTSTQDEDDALKAGDTCIRCKAGTWLKENIA
ncbi:hypothetical protein BG011_003790 [Mortierella polycephala]|uniref:Uncharacterized protein n=1 Tax=Mortierella polycephala TaxID=41804 RepID=A0A9P6Q264_9FUNG|nr:hypothetical protein BG011_003790 [Mortierella polycephala]